MNRNLKKIVLLVVLVAVAAFLWWTISPLFISTAVNDELDPALIEMVQSGETTEGVSISEASPIIDTPIHPASGSVRLIQTPDQTIVRFEDYDGTNGPDLRVYIAKDLEANEFVDLGPARGNVGNINYEVPADVSVEEYKYVMTWCRAFGVLFDYAEIN